MTYRVRRTVMKDSVELSSELMDARFREREEAAAYIVNLQIKFQNRGYDRDKDRWWGKQDDEAETRIWSIEADKDDQAIADVFKERSASPGDASEWQAVKRPPYKQSSAGQRTRETGTAAREIVSSNKVRTDAKTARLKAQREAAEAAAPKPVKTKAKKAKKQWRAPPSS